MSEKLQHTPGPWRWWVTVNGARVAGRPADGSSNFVCNVVIPERAVFYQANACLIAAAPDLLEALEVTRGQWIHSINAPMCLAAIAKARE